MHCYILEKLFCVYVKLVMLQGVNPRDSGGWTCRVTATVAGQTQVSADIVRLFVGEYPWKLCWEFQLCNNEKRLTVTERNWGFPCEKEKVTCYRIYISLTMFSRSLLFPSWRLVVYNYNITAAGNAISSMLSSSCQEDSKRETSCWWKTGGKGGVPEAESDDRKKAWFSINHSILSDSPPAKLGRTPCRASPPWEGPCTFLFIYCFSMLVNIVQYDIKGAQAWDIRLRVFYINQTYMDRWLRN